MSDAHKTPPRILVIEDEFAIRLVIEDTLRAAGFSVVTCDTAETAVTLLAELRFDLLIVDLNLPRMPGDELIRSVRSRDQHTGIIVVSCHSGQASHDHCFAIGVDDYLDKPFSPRELLNRVSALIRRLPATVNRTWTWRGIVLCFKTKQCWVEGEAMSLTLLEYQLLAHFAHRPGEAISRHDLLDEVWGMDSATNARSVDAFICGLRRKFETLNQPIPLESVRGVGYRLRV